MTVIRLLPRKTVLPIAVLVLLLGACTDPTIPFPQEPTFTGRWAGQPWTGEASVTLVDGGDAPDTLYVGGTRPVNAGSTPAEWIRIRVPFHGAGTYQLGADGTGTADLYVLTGGDVISATYSTTALNAGTLVVTAYHGPGGLIEGRVDFVASSASQYRSYGPTAAFEDGQFHAAVRTRP